MHRSSVVPFLSDPCVYPHHPRRVDVVQTHASWVFLAGDLVYKIKKPVDFGFLDFSTLARRRRFCRREVELNRRLAPDVYLDVATIRRSGRTLALDGEGPVIEVAVKMRRLRDGGFASARLAHGRLEAREIDRIAARLVAFYRDRAAETARPLRDRQRRSIEDNLRLIRRHAATRVERRAVDALSAYTRSFYASHRVLLARRPRERRVLDCHGDLRLDHVHIERQTVRIYDCIEFNDRLRTIDIANDVAFLAMDLDFEGRPDLARRLVRTIGRRCEDPQMERLVDFYRCYRAAVRNKVERLRAAEREVLARERTASAARADRFLRLALRYATLGSRPVVVVVMGEIASGKSTLAAGLADALGIDAISSDVTRKRLARLRRDRRPDAVVRRRLYGDAMSRRVYAAMLAATRRTVRDDRSLLLDATFARRADRARVVATAERLGASVLFIELATSAAVRRRRLAARDRAPSSISDARLEDLHLLTSRYEAPVELGRDALLRLRCGKTADATLGSTLKALATRRGTR